MPEIFLTDGTAAFDDADFHIISRITPLCWLLESHASSLSSRGFHMS